MLSDADIKEIRKAVRAPLHRITSTNREIDLSELPDAIVETIIEAIKQYDRLSHS